MPDGARLTAFYERAYSTDDPAQAALYSRWRALGARGKAQHVERLLGRAGLAPASVLEVGCGDGAVLAELARRGVGSRHDGLELSPRAAAIARAAEGVDEVRSFDGETLPVEDHAYDLGLLSHVLEHVTAPAALLSETARACRAVVVEVPLEQNLSARRPSKRSGAAAVGHLQSFSRERMRATLAQAGLRPLAELEDPLPLAVHRFFAPTPRARVRATAKWALRTLLHGAAPPLARRLFTLHYAVLAVPGA